MRIVYPSNAPAGLAGGVTTTDDYPGPQVAFAIINGQCPVAQAQAVTRINQEYSPSILTTSTDTFPAMINEAGKIAHY